MVSIITNDGRNFVGVLRGYDGTTNIILDECHERVFSTQVRAACCSSAGASRAAAAQKRTRSARVEAAAQRVR